MREPELGIIAYFVTVMPSHAKTQPKLHASKILSPHSYHVAHFSNAFGFKSVFWRFIIHFWLTLGLDIDCDEREASIVVLNN